MSAEIREPASSGSASPAERSVATIAETGPGRASRGVRRALFYVYMVAATAVIVILVALVVANRGVITVSWVFGSSSVSLVWLIFGAVLLGLLLGLLLVVLVRHWRRGSASSAR